MADSRRPENDGKTTTLQGTNTLDPRKTPSYVRVTPDEAPPEVPLQLSSSRTMIGVPTTAVLQFLNNRRAAEAEAAAKAAAASSSVPTSTSVTLVSVPVAVDPPGGRDDVSGPSERAQPVHEAPVMASSSPTVALIPAYDPPSGRVRGGSNTDSGPRRTSIASVARSTPAGIEVLRQPLPSPPDPRMVIVSDLGSEHASSFRALRQRIVQASVVRTVIVTSAGAADGKTFTAVNLAFSLAELGRRRVLLVEANGRSPSLAAWFELKKPPCFLDQLEVHRRDPGASWTVVDVATHGLEVLPISSTDRGGGRRVDAPTFRTAMEQFRMVYDYVVVDGPAVSGGPEISLMQDAADGILIAARASRARAGSLNAAIEQVTPSNVLGLVLLR